MTQSITLAGHIDQAAVEQAIAIVRQAQAAANREGKVVYLVRTRLGLGLTTKPNFEERREGILETIHPVDDF